MRKKEYHVGELFKMQWNQMSAKDMVQVWILLESVRLKNLDDEKESLEYGIIAIAILRILRLRPLVIDNIKIHQVRDVFVDVEQKLQPWYYFPEKKLLGMVAPDEYMHDRSFDHFIYADNEFSLIGLYQAKGRVDEMRYHMAKLVACIYNEPDQIYFDEDRLHDRANRIMTECADHQLELVMYTYKNIRTWILEKHPLLFPRDEDDSAAKEIVPTGGAWLKIKHRLAETPVFQGMDTAGKARVLKALDYLEDLADIRSKSKTA